MPEEPREYHIRYSIEQWDKPIASETTRVEKNVRMSHDQYGYADEVIVTSILFEEDDEGGVSPSSVAFFDSLSENGRQPPRVLMELLVKQALHYLEHHCPD